MAASLRPSIDYTHKDYASLLGAMLELARDRLPEWTDHSPNDLGVMLLELFASMGDAMFYYQDRIANESFLETARERRSVVHLLRLIGYELRPPVPATADLTLLFDSSANDVTINPGDEFTTTRATTGEPVTFQYVKPARTIRMNELDLPSWILSGGKIVPERDAPPSEKRYRRYGPLPVMQVDRSIQEEIVGSSDGSGGQRFPLADKPLILESLTIHVVEAGVRKTWTRTGTLLHSIGTDEHYVVRRDENDVAWIELGDGRYGKAPPRGRNNVIAIYRVGGGAKGNVAPRTIVKGQEGVTLVMNENAAAGGVDAEPIEQAARRGPLQFRSMERAVTAADYEFHAKSFGVARARAHAPGWNRIELFVVPAGGGFPSDTLKDDLRRYFETRRMMTCLVEIRDPKYIDVEIEAKITVDPRYSPEEMKAAAEQAVRALWSIENIDFEATLYISKIYEAIEAIDGIAGATAVKLRRKGGQSEDTLRFAFDEIPNVTTVTLEEA